MVSSVPPYLGNAKRFVAAYGADIRYVHPQKEWLTWTGSRWAVDTTGAVMLLAKQVLADMWQEVTVMVGDERREFVRHLGRSESIDYGITTTTETVRRYETGVTPHLVPVASMVLTAQVLAIGTPRI